MSFFDIPLPALAGLHSHTPSHPLPHTCFCRPLRRRRRHTPQMSLDLLYRRQVHLISYGHIPYSYGECGRSATAELFERAHNPRPLRCPWHGLCRFTLGTYVSMPALSPSSYGFQPSRKTAAAVAGTIRLASGS
ncbi:hypothetical protein BD309DRAFT_989461 [Dichomitus squalens]|uniref:Uncharacterized protein n=2 Tax=Dichomitus squalens TaxID=114155 RepID=A0A4Q9PUC6_9APHY|nr:uncharacterized protein DICSQDRAFT_155415 [Dichomitus squalens LYAD-421 SS1]EJF60973.1 hypothetical protein DICSQDRAFT_155415 [Dichomitus squalens LYAD-421 SS1]TBU45562.1 hypothetical protein BD309DRAFT_989461 [Dichomitus squalens]TBU58096.1 hypothetical protein BD310DRAFT_820248 [Dichomitus squalens]